MNIDNILGKMVNKKKKIEFDNVKTWNIGNKMIVNKPNTPYKPAQVINNILPIKKTSIGPAPVRQQQIWRTMPIQQKIVSRITMKDNDRDGYPNKYDCQPNNPNKDRVTSLNESMYKSNKQRIKKETEKNPGKWIVYDSYEDYPENDELDLGDMSFYTVTSGPLKGKDLRTHETKVVEKNGEYILLYRKLKKPQIIRYNYELMNRANKKQ